MKLIKKYNRLFAITISKNYPFELSIMLDRNAKHFDKWFIVTQEDDAETIKEIESRNLPNVEIVFYPLVPDCHSRNHVKSSLTGKDTCFSYPEWELKNKSDEEKKEYKKSKKLKFDKGGGILSAQKKVPLDHDATNDDLILLLDSDIVLPDNFIEVLSGYEIKSDTLYGANRCDYLFYKDFLEDKDSTLYRVLECAGFFQLYRYDPTKLAKRTHDCGWVDLEFANQFKKREVINGLSVKHLGMAGINWEGKTTPSFIDDRENDELMKIANKLEIITFEKSTQVAKERIRVRLTGKQINNEEWSGFPSFLIPGFQKCGSLSLKLNLTQHSNIRFGGEFNSEISYCSNEKYVASSWNNTWEWYLRHFHKEGSLWGDYSGNLLGKGCKTSIDRMKTTYIEYKKKWAPNVSDVKFLIVVRNPIERAFAEYAHYMVKFPESCSWSWEHPGQSFLENIKTEINNLQKLQKTDKQWFLDETLKGRLILNGVYAPIIEYFKSHLKLKDNQLKVVSLTQLETNSEKTCEDIFNFLEVPNETIKFKKYNSYADQYKLTDKAKDVLLEFYDPYNKQLHELTGIKYNEK
jgi:hypothetical protein